MKKELLSLPDLYENYFVGGGCAGIMVFNMEENVIW